MAGTMPYLQVDTPQEQPPAPFGLFSAATPILITDPHGLAGVQYEYDCATGLMTWPGMCGASTPAPVPVSATPALTGTRTGTDPDFVYSLSVAVPSTPADRSYTVTVVADGNAYVVQASGSGTVVPVYTDRTGASAGTITITDNITGDTLGPLQWAQAADGTVTSDLPSPWTYNDVGMPLKRTPPDWQTITGDPFTVVATEECLPVGYTLEQLNERARRRLRTNEQGAVERVIWTGAQGNNPNLAGSSPTVLGGSDTTPVDIVTAVGLIEEWYGQAHTGDGPAFVHANRRVASLAQRFAQATTFGTIKQTPLQHTWVFGEGYPLTGPANAAPAAGGAWIFVTSPVTVRRTEIRTNAGMAYRQNLPHHQAERSYVVSWHCAVAAVQVDLTANNTANAAAAA